MTLCRPLCALHCHGWLCGLVPSGNTCTEHVCTAAITTKLCGWAEWRCAVCLWCRCQRELRTPGLRSASCSWWLKIKPTWKWPQSRTMTARHTQVGKTHECTHTVNRLIYWFADVGPEIVKCAVFMQNIFNLYSGWSRLQILIYRIAASPKPTIAHNCGCH